MKSKSDVLACFKDIHKGVQTQYGEIVKILRSDNGTEYTNRAFAEYLSSQGIQHQTTCPYTPEQNGVAERKNRHLLEVTRSMMISMNVPKHLWGQAVLTAAYLINRVPSRILDWKSPFEMLRGTMQNNLPLRTFGCVCFVQDNRPNVGKLDPRAVRCIFVGYSATKKEYVCWSPVEKRLFVSMDVTFRELEPYYRIGGGLPFGDPLDQDNGRQEEEDSNGERRTVTVNLDSTGAEMEDERAENENGETHAQGEPRYGQVYVRRTRQDERVVTMPHVPGPSYMPAPTLDVPTPSNLDSEDVGNTTSLSLSSLPLALRRTPRINAGYLLRDMAFLMTLPTLSHIH